MMFPKNKHKNIGFHNYVIYSKIEEILFKNRNKIVGNILDLGCGEQNYKATLLETGSTYFGIDWGNSFHNIQVDLVADLNEIIPLKDNFADTIISISVLEHLKEPILFISETHRLLKPEGYILLQVPFQWHIHEQPYDYQRFTSYGLQDIFQKAGYHEISVIPTCGLFTTIGLKLNYFGLKFIRGPKFLRFILRNLLNPFWFVNLVICRLLDKLDNNWSNETQGYWVVAKKQIDDRI